MRVDILVVIQFMPQSTATFTYSTLPGSKSMAS